MRIFITGATGFAGSHLVDQLLEEANQLFLLTHTPTTHHKTVKNESITTIVGDILAPDQLKEVVCDIKPDIIYHLAGQASPGQSWKIPARTIEINTAGTANLLDAAVASGRPRVVVITSAEIYGPIRPHQLPLNERTVPQPHHPYGISKWAAGQLVQAYWQRYQLPVIEARPFNHIGPRQALGYVVPDFASQLASIQLGLSDPVISVGNLDAQRDFTDVRDMVRAYRHLADKGLPGETYLICSGHPVPIQYLLNTLLKRVEKNVIVNRDPNRMRPSDTPTLYGSYTKIERDTGWRPEIHLQETLFDAFDDWINRLSKQNE